MADLTPGQRYGQDDVARIIRRASELQEKHGGVPASIDGVTLGEIEQIAAEVGISPEWVREAATRPEPAPAQAAAPAPKPTRGRSRLYGGPRHYRCETSLDVAIRSTVQLTALPNIIHDVLERHGESRVTSDGLEWEHVAGAGSVHVSVTSAGGSTHIVAEADRSAQARRNLTLGTLGGGALLGFMGAATGEPAAFLVLASIGAGAGAVTGRLWWNRQSEKWRKRLNAVIQRVSDSVGAHYGPAGSASRSGFDSELEASRSKQG